MITKSFLGTVVGVALLAMSGAANAVTISIGFQQAGVNGGAITTENTGTDVAVTASGNYGTFISNSVTGVGSPPNAFGDLLSSTSLNVSTNTAGTLDVWVTASNITAPIGNLDFISSLTSNLLPVGWTVTETTLLDTSNGLYSGTTLASNMFNTIGTFVSNNLAATGLGPYSVTEHYTVVATGAGTALSTMNLSAVPSPIVGAGLPGLIAACSGLLALARRRRKARV